MNITLVFRSKPPVQLDPFYQSNLVDKPPTSVLVYSYVVVGASAVPGKCMAGNGCMDILEVGWLLEGRW